MRMIKYVSGFAFAGFAIPVLLNIFWSYYELYISFEASLWIEKFVLISWPSSILMIGTAGHKGINYEILSISIIVNVVLYAIIGLLIWIGLNKQRWVLYLIFVLIALIWCRLLTI